MTPHQRQQYNLRNLLVVMLVFGLTLAWLRERQLRVPETLLWQARDTGLELASRLAEESAANQLLQIELKHLETRMRTLAAQHGGSPQLRGNLEVDDPTVTYVRQLPSFADPLTWKYEVYLPPNRAPRMHVRLGSVPRDATAEDNGQCKVVPGPELSGYNTIEISISNPAGQWHLNVNAASQTVSIPLALEITFGQPVDLGRQISRLAARYEDSNELRHSPTDRTIELFRLSNGGDASGIAGDETGVVVYFQPAAEPEVTLSVDDLP